MALPGVGLAAAEAGLDSFLPLPSRVLETRDHVLLARLLAPAGFLFQAHTCCS